MADRELTVILSSGEITTYNKGGTAATDAILNKGENDAQYVPLAGDVAAVKAQYTPQASVPTHVEGQMYYYQDKEEFRLQGPFPGVEVGIGHGMHIHIVNNSGVLIEKGSACANDGVSVGGIPQAKKAIADSFDNAIIFGVALHDIPDGAEGAISTFGQIRTLDTSLLPVGVPLYLSDTVAGTYTATAPDIVSQVGGVLVSDATDGELFVFIESNIVLPSVLGLLQGQTGMAMGIYDLVIAPQNITNYANSGSVAMIVSQGQGTITVPSDGFYNGSFTASLSFGSTTSTRTIYVDIYNQTTATTLFSYPFNVPRDATEGGISFSSIISANENDVFIMRMSSLPDITVELTDVGMTMNSVRI